MAQAEAERLRAELREKDKLLEVENVRAPRRPLAPDPLAHANFFASANPVARVLPCAPFCAARSFGASWMRSR